MRAPPLHARALRRRRHSCNILRPRTGLRTCLPHPKHLVSGGKGHVVDVACGSSSTEAQPSAKASPWLSLGSGPRDSSVSPVPSFSLFSLHLRTEAGEERREREGRKEGPLPPAVFPPSRCLSRGARSGAFAPTAAAVAAVAAAESLACCLRQVA